MKGFARAYTYYFFICFGVMVMALMQFILGGYMFSAIMGTEITPITINVAAGFVIFAPALLAFLTMEEQ